MKVIAIQTSPNKDGLTSSLAQAVLKGVEMEGGARARGSRVGWEGSKSGVEGGFEAVLSSVQH